MGLKGAEIDHLCAFSYFFVFILANVSTSCQDRGQTESVNKSTGANKAGIT